MTDTATPEPTSRRRLVIILAVTAVAVIAVIAGLFLYASSAAGSRVSDYEDDYAAWQAKEKPLLVAATAKLPAGTYLREDEATVKGLATQEKGCDAVAASRKKVSAAAEGLPTMGDNALFGRLNADYSDAGDTADRREKTVRAYVKAASKTLAQIEHDCRWNIAFNAAGVQADKLWDSSDTYSLEPGDTEPGGIFCAKGRDNGCVSSIAKKKNKYADLRIKATKLYGARIAKFYSSKECGTTSYASACPVMLKAFSTYNKRQLKNYQYVRTMKSSVNNLKLRSNNDALDKLYEKQLPQVRKAVLALDPALKADKEVRESPSWSDHFFARMAKELLADLKDERATIAKL